MTTLRGGAGWWATTLLFLVATVGSDLALARAYRWLVPAVDFRALERAYRRPDPTYHHGLAANVDLVGAWGGRRYPLRTDSLGFKDATCRTVPLQTSGRRLLLIGDSFTEGVGFPFEETFAGRIAAALAPAGVEVLNAAAVSYAPSIYYRKVKYLIEDVGLAFAELVVFLDPSDVWDEAEMYRLDADDRVVATADVARLWLGDAPDAPPDLDDWLVERSIVARALRTAWRRAHARAESAPCPGSDRDPLATVTDVPTVRWSFDDVAFADVGRRGLAQAQAGMDRLLALLRRHDRALTVVVYPWPDHVLRGDRESRQVTLWRAWAAERGVRFIDLFPVFVGTADPPAAVVARDYIPCDVHFSAEGHRRVAEAFLRAAPGG